LPTDYGFTGQRNDSYIKLLDYVARRYDPQIGRFISPDSIVPNPGDPRDLNRYAYVRNNPLRYTDPSGHVLVGGVAPDDSYMQRNAYGVQFTAGAGASWNWDGRGAYLAVLDGVEAMAQSMVGALAQRNKEYAKTGDFDLMVNVPPLAALFKETMGGINFRIMPQCQVNGCFDGVDPGAWAWSQIGNLGEVWVNENAFAMGYTGVAAERNTVHELGHGIDQRGGGAASRNLAAAWAAEPRLTRNSGGFAAGGGWQQNPSSAASEVFADMVLGWTYNRWDFTTGAGVIKSRYMRANMPSLIALAVAGN
jgi:RHS repeat-associated protein